MTARAGEPAAVSGPWLALWAVPGVLLAATVYEAALLLELAGDYGPEPGAGVDGEEMVALVAQLTMLAGAVVAFVHAFYARAPWAVALFAPAAAAFVTVRFYTYDPYYLPGLRRYSESGGMSEDWILGTLGAAIAVGVATRLTPRAGSVVTALLLPVLLMTSLLAAAGH